MNDSTAHRALVEHRLHSLESRIREIMDAFADMLEGIGKGTLARHLPWRAGPEPRQEGTPLDPIEVAQLYSIAFQLLDMVEERVAMNTRREREKTFGAQAEKGLWPERLQSLKDLGLRQEDIAKGFGSILIEPVFTAHPTEAKRTSVRERHREIYQLLLKLEQEHYTDQERALIRDRLVSALEALWFTGEIHRERPTVKRELHNVLFYLCDMFPDVLARLDQHLAKSWEEAGFDSKVLAEAGDGSQTRFGLWIGGDRDGHPFVTAEVTAETLALLRKRAQHLYRSELRHAGERLTVSPNGRAAPPALQARLDELVECQGERGKAIRKRYREEPWRALCHLLGEWVVWGDVTHADALHADLTLIEDTLSAAGCARLGHQFLQPVKRKLGVFGFHLADLDVRQNSAFHDQAADQLFAVAGIEDGESFSRWSEDDRVAFLTSELASARPMLQGRQPAGPQADAVRDCYRVLAAHWKNYGDGLGALIVSMTRQLSDLLLVHLFAREAGLAVYRKGALPACPLQVVPLFETLADLRKGAVIVEAYLRHPVAQRSLALQESDPITQQIMLGYSDSNKDAGILASQLALHQAQREIYEVGQREGTEIRFFHGRGGTVSRGAGPIQWFVNTLPRGSLNRGLRMTEQGESIAAKYAHLASATYNLELLQACSLHAGLTQQHHAPDTDDESVSLMEPLAQSSQAAYRELIERVNFLSFYRQATPIDALEETRMGSRPSRRSQKASLDDLRAIPWVFSWTQARFYLPGWYGAGSALEALQRDHPAAYESLASALRDSGFVRYVFTNVESSLASSSLDLMHAYAGLVDEAPVRETFMNMIETEHAIATKHLRALFSQPLKERRPRFSRTLELRQAPLRTLHLQQIDLLRQWREHGGPLPNELLYIINAISSGLQTTG